MNIGVKGTGGNGQTNYGVYGEAANSGTGINYAGYFLGDVYVTGTVTTVNGVAPSDSMFKTNIDSIHSALYLVSQLKPATYNYNTSYNNRFSFNSGLNYGFIAQEVAQVIPELVKNSLSPPIMDTLGNIVAPALPYKSLNYQGIIPILTKAIQEQQHEIHDKDSVINALRVSDSILRVNDSLLNVRLSNLESCISALGLCDGGNGNGHGGGNGHHKSMTTSSTDVELKDGQSIVLDQNVPNPFAEQTTISYFLPEDISKAQMLFYNAQGKLIQSTELTQRGQGTLNVFAQDLSSGIYTYTLVVDGKVFETKKMVRQ